MNKLLLVASSATLLNAWELPAEDHPFHPMKLMQEHGRLQQTYDAGLIEPLVGRNFISIVLTDLVNIIANPSWRSLWAIFVDVGAFFALPLLGGTMNATVQHNVEKDPLTYQHA